MGLLPEDEMNYAEMVFPRLPVGWECEASGEFFVEIFNATQDVPDHGWKLRVNTACLTSFPAVLRAVSIICFSDGINFFKCAKSPGALRQLHAKNIGIEIAGKALTLYLGTDERLLKYLITKLTPALEVLSLTESNAPWSDRRIGKSLSYRYGSYLPQSTLRIADIDFTDRRDIFMLPPGILDPFENTSTPPREPEEVESVLFHDYEISGVISRNWGGSVYSGRSLHTTEEVVIKEARPDAFIACEVLSTALLENEYHVLKFIEKFQIAPVPIDDLLEIDRHLFLVLKKIDGVNLFQWRLYHGSDPERCKAVAKKLTEQTSLIHATGTTHGDISMANIIISPDDSVRLIDFEMARLNSTKEDFAVDIKQLAKILWTLLLLNSKDNRNAIWLAEQGGPIQHILDRLNQ